LTLVASCLFGQGFSSSLESRLEHVLDLLEDRFHEQDGDFQVARGARAALDAHKLEGWRRDAYMCYERAVGIACPLATDKDICQASFETRSIVASGVQINGSKCVWCENGCTTNNNNKCEPKNWLERQSNAKDFEICPRTDNPYHTWAYVNFIGSNLNWKSEGGTGGYSKCYSRDSCMTILSVNHNWLATGGRRLEEDPELEYVTMQMDVHADFSSDENRRLSGFPTYMSETVRASTHIIKYIGARDGRMCQAGDAISNTPTTCALNADICIRMECATVEFTPDWSTQAPCSKAGFIKVQCK